MAVIKLGGSAMDVAQGVLDDIADLWHAGARIVLVHGGGPAITRWQQRLGIAPHFIDGRRVTDDATLAIVRAVMCGEVNTEIVRLLVQRDVRAVGLSGLDSGLIRVLPAEANLGLVGVVPRADPHLITALLDAGYLPAIAPLGMGPDGECRNVNADDAAMAIAVALGARDLIFMSDVSGVHDAAGARIAELTPQQARALIASGAVTGGMLPKIEDCLAALEYVQRVHIASADQPGAVHLALGSGQHPGTRIVRG
jgi:acetylglutamate kinase